MTAINWIIILASIANALAVQAFWPRVGKWWKGARDNLESWMAFLLFTVCYGAPVAFGFVAGMLVRL